MLFTEEQLQGFNQQTFAFLEVEEKDHLLTITLNRPEKKNALHPVMVDELAYSLTYAKTNKDIWAVLLKANGNIFCAGADLKAFMVSNEEINSSIPKPDGDILIGELFNKLYKPCIAQVEGDIYAGGFLLLCGCTHIIAADDIKLGLPEVKRGLFPYQVLAGLMEVIPAKKALDWCIRGYTLDVNTAKDWGLITKVCPKDDVANEANRLIQEIFVNSPTAIRMGLEAFDNIRQSGTKEQHQYLKEMLMKTLQTKDAQEGIIAFKQKREPAWTGE